MTIVHGRPWFMTSLQSCFCEPCWSGALYTGACAPAPDGVGVCCMQSRSMLEPRPLKAPHSGGVLAGGPE